MVKGHFMHESLKHAAKQSGNKVRLTVSGCHHALQKCTA